MKLLVLLVFIVVVVLGVSVSDIGFHSGIGVVDRGGGGGDEAGGIGFYNGGSGVCGFVGGVGRVGFGGIGSVRIGVCAVGVGFGVVDVGAVGFGGSFGVGVDGSDVGVFFCLHGGSGVSFDNVGNDSGVAVISGGGFYACGFGLGAFFWWWLCWCW